MANPQHINSNAQANPGAQGSQQSASGQSGQQNAGGQGQWGNQDLYGNQGAGMYNPATWGMGNMPGGPYSGPNQGYGVNWYGVPQYASLGPIGYPMGGYGSYGYGPGMGFGMPQYTGFGGWGAPSTETITEWWLIPGPATGLGPQNVQRSDERIKEDVHDRLTAHGQLDARGITANVSKGEVTLTGTVDSRQAKHLAEDVAGSVPGVKDVHNQLTVQPPQGRPGWQPGQQPPQQGWERFEGISAPYGMHPTQQAEQRAWQAGSLH